jgi:lysozyme family protein
MTGDFKECLDIVLKSEGGFTCDTRDPGNAGGKCTNLGITQQALEEWLGHEVDEKFMRKLTPEMAAPFYEQKYWRPTYCEILPRGLDLLVFSMGINGGPGRAVKLLQQAIGCVPDGVVGQRTMGLIKQSNVADLIAKYSDARRMYYKSLNKPVFEKGWLNRVDHEEAQALNMAKNS